MKSILIILMLPALAFGQINLVPNGSFEQLDSCPTGNSCGGLIELAVPWFEPTNCTSDLAHGCTIGVCGIPNAGVFPVDGDGMAGIALFGGQGEEAREYIAVKLNSTLLQDTMYELKIRLHKSGGSGTSVGSVGAYFSQDSMTNYALNHDLFELTPQLQRNPDSLMDNHNIWYEWRDTISANGDENFMILGNFLSDANTPYHQPSWNPSSFCFIDDVRLTKISKPNSINELDVRFGLYPNPSTNVVRIDYTGNLSPVMMRLLTIEGRLAFSAPWQRSLDVSELSEGLYLLQVEFSNGAVGTQRLVLQR